MLKGIGLLVIILTIGVIGLIPRVKGSLLSGFVIFVTICAAITLSVIRPSLHKPLSLSVVEYLIQINDDGSMTTTKQTTTTELGKLGK